jgi:hypothetical protein
MIGAVQQRKLEHDDDAVNVHNLQSCCDISHSLAVLSEDYVGEHSRRRVIQFYGPMTIILQPQPLRGSGLEEAVYLPST